MEFNVRLILSFCAVFCSQYIITSVDAVIGQNVRLALRNEIPFMVSFQRNMPGYMNPLANHFCAGAIITRRHVLSVAHCTTMCQANETMILAGSNSLRYGMMYYVQWWINYAEWANYRHRLVLIGINDISITKLTQEVDNSIPAAMLSPIPYQNLYDGQALLAGWGRTNNGDTPEFLLVGDVRILSLTECKNRITALDGRRTNFSAKLLCTAADPYIFIQQGDIGGPLIHRNYIIGINKETRPFGEMRFHHDKVNIHMNIEYYRDFIGQTIDQNFDWH